jgi:iron(III) transport system substrate-binding protein
MITRRGFVVGGTVAAGAAGLYAPALVGRAEAQGAPSWLDPAMLQAAKAEGGSLTVYSSVNEQEGLPFWKVFEEGSGIKVDYVRGSDTALQARIALEARAQQKSWDLVATTAVNRLPADFMATVDVPQMSAIGKDEMHPERKWIGMYSNYNSPAYNTNLVKQSDLPKSYEEFATKKEWKGKVAIDATDAQWMWGMFAHFGEDKAKKILKDIAEALQPVTVDGHLALARQVALGEYWVALNNYTSLTNNVKLAGGPTDFWVLEPVVVFYGQVGVSARAPHPKTAALAVNYVLSKEGQSQLPKFGRIPIRKDVLANPPDTMPRLETKKILRANLTGDDEKKWRRTFDEIFKPR